MNAYILGTTTENDNWDCFGYAYSNKRYIKRADLFTICFMLENYTGFTIKEHIKIFRCDTLDNRAWHFDIKTTGDVSYIDIQNKKNLKQLAKFGLYDYDTETFYYEKKC